MNDFQSFAPSAAPGPGPLIASVIFYGFVIFATFFSASSIYILIKYGQSKIVSLTVSLVYGFIFLALVGQGIHLLALLK